MEAPALTEEAESEEAAPPPPADSAPPPAAKPEAPAAKEGAGGPLPAKPLPVRQYLDTTVVPVLRQGLKALVKARPEDPFEFLAAYLREHGGKS